MKLTISTSPWHGAITILALVLASSAAPMHAAEFHISPAGRDSNPGTATQPFQTITRGRDAVRDLKARSGLPEGGVDVVLHGGEYRLKQTLELTPLDSGAKGRPVRWRAAQGESPVLTSARDITGWNKYGENNSAVTEAAKGHLWVAEVPKGWRFHNLYINGEPQQVSRAPNADVKQWRSWPRAQGNGQFTPDGMRVAVPGNLLAQLPSNGDVEVNFLAVEYWNILPVLKKIDGNTAVLASRNPCTWVFGGKYFSEGSMLFRNALALLDQPGEWCVDSAAGRVYFWPPDDTMAGKTVTAPTLDELIRVQGDDLAARRNEWRVKFDAKGNRIEKSTPPLAASSPAAFDQLVRHVEFRALSFQFTDRMSEDQWPADWLKRNAENPDGALFLQGVEACVIADCHFRDCGAYAMVLDHYAQRVSVLRNEMGRLGSGGVQASGYGPGTLDVNHHHIIRRNYIHDTGRDYMHSAAITIFGSGHNDVSLNWIATMPYAAVQICGANHTVLNNPDHPQHGPSFDLYGDRTAQFQMRSHELPSPNGRNDAADFEEVKPFLHSGGNWIARNVVDEFMTTMGDGAALYCWSVDHDNVWLENLLKCTRANRNMFVIYMDDWTGRTIIESNIAWSPGNLMDNSHNPTPAARPAPPGVRATGRTVVQWRNNGVGFPAKPAGYDERMQSIVSEVAAEGGWPPALDKTTASKPVDLAVGAWVRAREARRLNGPRFHDDQRETIGWCEGGGSLVFGPFRFPPAAPNAMELEAGVDPHFAGGRMHVRLDSADGPTIGTFTFRSTGGFEQFKTQRIPVQGVSGEHPLVFVFEGGNGICNLKAFRFVLQ